MLLSCVVVVFVLFHACLASNLCAKTEFYNDSTGECKPCLVCPKNSLLVVPCSKFSNTMCADLEEIKLSIQKNKMQGAKWHETEGRIDTQVYLADKSDEKSPETDKLWTQLSVCLLFLSFVCLSVSLILWTRQIFRKSFVGGHRHRLVPQNRFFNTTEYMNTLASVDRSMALDDILEKKKLAMMGEPVVLADEVFVDISGLPPRYGENEEHTRCLLQIREH